MCQIKINNINEMDQSGGDIFNPTLLLNWSRVIDVHQLELNVINYIDN